MLVLTDQYSVTTLCKRDPEVIQKVGDRFRHIVCQIYHENPELIGRVLIGGENVQKLPDIEFGKTIISRSRLTWIIKGEKDALESFFSKWNEYDTNPLMQFRVRPEYSLSQISELMSIHEWE